MTSKKISEFAPETKVRNDDIVLITTGLRTGETPATKIVTKQQLNISEGAGRVFDAIMSLEPVHYWPMQAPYTELFDVVTNTTTVPVNFVGDIMRGGISKDYSRPCHIFGATKHIDTNIDATHLAGAKTVAFMLRATSTAVQRLLGCSSNVQNGWDIALNDPTTGLISFRHFNGSQFIRMTGPFSINTNDLWVWTFNETTGHEAFKNGTSVLTSNNTTLVNYTGSRIAIGKSGDPGENNHPYLGFVQDVAIWDKVLTSQEILNLSNLILG